jgi:hypothetical protein
MISSLDEEGARCIRKSIIAGCKSLDSWEADYLLREEKRKKANARHANGFAGRLADARHVAKSAYPQSQGIEEVLDPTEVLQVRTHENPSRGIHRAIIHKIYVEIGCLYKLSYPRFYPGRHDLLTRQGEEVLPVPLTGPDYLTLAVTESAGDLQASSGHRPSDIRSQRPDCLPILRLYFSKSFPITFSEFCSRVADQLEDLEEDQV